MRHGNLFVISGPSGAGKGALVARLLEEVPDVWISLSATTRPARKGEKDGVHYQFLSPEAFDALVNEGGLLEWAVYSDNKYGTPQAAVEQHIALGQQVILEIDVQGALQVRKKMPQARLVFVEPPSLQELERRLRLRGTEDETAIQQRLQIAQIELSYKLEYDYVLVNDDLECAVQELVAYINKCAENGVRSGQAV